MSSIARTLPKTNGTLGWTAAGLRSALALAFVGVELAVLATLLPETVETWWRADQLGDFPMFFDAARHLDANGIYGPSLSLLIHPLTCLGIANPYRAYLAQRGVESPEAKLAVALGVLAVPQMHWALRFGHLTPFLALAAPVACAALYAALLVSQAATPRPVVDLSYDAVGTAGHFFMVPGDTCGPSGLYWITPLTLGAVCLLALATRPRAKDEPAGGDTTANGGLRACRAPGAGGGPAAGRLFRCGLRWRRAAFRRPVRCVFGGCGAGQAAARLPAAAG